MLTKLSSAKPIIHIAYGNVAWTRLCSCRPRRGHDNSRGVVWNAPGTYPMHSLGELEGKIRANSRKRTPIIFQFFGTVSYAKLSKFYMSNHFLDLVFCPTCHQKYCFLILPYHSPQSLSFLICICWILSSKVLSLGYFMTGQGWKMYSSLHLSLILKEQPYLWHFCKFEENSPWLGTVPPCPNVWYPGELS